MQVSGVILLRVVESLPLTVFLLAVALLQPRTAAQWRTPIFAASVLAVLVTIFLLRRRVVLNRIHLGIALYFVSAALVMASGWPRANALYAHLEGTMMLIWVLVLGTACTWLDPRGFIGLDASARAVRRGSALLLAITAAATALSLCQVGSRVWSAFVPFIAIFIAHAVIVVRLRRSTRGPA